MCAKILEQEVVRFDRQIASNSAMALIWRCLHRDVERRPRAAELIGDASSPPSSSSSSFFDGVEWDRMLHRGVPPPPVLPFCVPTGDERRLGTPTTAEVVERWRTRWLRTTWEAWRDAHVAGALHRRREAALRAHNRGYAYYRGLATGALAPDEEGELTGRSDHHTAARSRQEQMDRLFASRFSPLDAASLSATKHLRELSSAQSALQRSAASTTKRPALPLTHSLTQMTWWQRVRATVMGALVAETSAS